MNESDLNADAVAFGETRSTRSVVFWRNGDTEGCLRFWEKARGGRATFIFSLKLSYYQTVILSNCHTIKLSYCQHAKGCSPFLQYLPKPLRVSVLPSLRVRRKQQATRLTTISFQRLTSHVRSPSNCLGSRVRVSCLKSLV